MKIVKRGLKSLDKVVKFLQDLIQESDPFDIDPFGQAQEKEMPQEETQAPTFDAKTVSDIFGDHSVEVMPLIMAMIQHVIYFYLLDTADTGVMYPIKTQDIDGASEVFLGAKLDDELATDLIAACYVGPLGVMIYPPKDPSNWVSYNNLSEIDVDALLAMFGHNEEGHFVMTLCGAIPPDDSIPGLEHSVATARATATLNELNNICSQRIMDVMDQPNQEFVMSSIESLTQNFVKFIAVQKAKCKIDLTRPNHKDLN